MGIFDDIEGYASSILKAGKKKAPGAIMAGLPYIGPLKASVDLLGWDNTLNYVMPTLVGAGFGAAAGAPAFGVGAVPGAIIGGSAALASTILGPKAGHLVEEETGSDLAGTAAEFGVYGLGGGLGLGNAGTKMAARTATKVGMEKALAHLALKSSLEMGALSGVGAASGQGLARVSGVPEEFGVLAGGLGGPVLAPAAFGAARGAAYRTDNPALKNIAEYFGANEKNAIKANRTIDMRRSEVNTDAHSNMVDALDRTIAQHDMVLLRTAPEQTPEWYRVATGGYGRDELTARILGHDIPSIRDITTPEYINAKNRLRTRQNGLGKANEVYDETIAKYGAEASRIPEGGRMELRPTGTPREVVDIAPVPEGQIRLYNDGKGGPFSEQPVAGVENPHYLDMAADSATKYKGKGGYAIPKTAAKRAKPVPKKTETFESWFHVGDDGVERLVDDNAAKARMQVENATKLKGDMEGRMKKFLGVDEIPMDAAEQARLLRDKYIPDFDTKITEAQRALQDMTPDEALMRRMTGDADMAATNAKKSVERANSMRARGEAIGFKQFVLDNPELGAVRRGDVAAAARDFGALTQQTNLVKRYGTHGYLAARENAEPIERYLDFAKFVASKFGVKTDEYKNTMAGFFSSPRGQAYLEEAGGVVPVKLIGASEKAKSVTVARMNEASEKAIKVPWDRVTMRYPNMEQPLSEYLKAGPLNPNKLEGLTFSLPDGTSFRPTAVSGDKVDFAINGKAMTASVKDVVVTSNPGISGRAGEINQTVKDLRRSNRSKVYADYLRTETQKFHPVVPAVDERITAEKMASDLNTVRTDFMSHFMPTSTEVQGRYLTPEDHYNQVRGWKNLLTRGFKINAAKKTIDADAQALEYFTRKFQDRLGDVLSVDDVGLMDMFNASPMDSPMKSVIRMLGKSPDDYMRLINQNGDVHLGGAAGQTMRRIGIGESVQSAPLRALLADHYGGLEAHANTVGAMYQPLHNMIDEIAAELRGVPRGAAPQLRNAKKAFLDPTTRWHLGQALKNAASEVHPLSKDGQMAKLMEERVDWGIAEAAAKLKTPGASKQHLSDLGRGLKALEDEAPEHAELVKKWLLSKKETFEKYPELFGDLANEPRMNSAMKGLRFLNQEIREGGVLHGLAPDTEARIMMMNVHPDIRNMIDRDVIRQGSGNERIKKIFEGGATDVDLALEVIKGMKNKGINKPLAEMLTWGREADMARPVSTMQSMQIRETMEKLGKMANRQITPDDIVFKGGNWSINSQNKWPAEIAKDLDGFNDIIGGKHKWAGLQKVSQQIAYGNLAADLSLLGIQGYKYLAHSLLAGNGIEAFRNYAGFNRITPGVGASSDIVKKQMNTVTSHIMSDHGFYSWLRTNLDEVQYYSALGLTGGLKGYVAGPEIRKLPLETMPVVGKSWIGKGFTGIRQGTDLQFNRQLYYWKVQGIRENLEVAKMLRAGGRDFAARYINDLPEGSPTKTAADELGLDGYLLGEREDTVRSVVRSVNRSMGGVNMSAEGIGMDRQALEQIMMIVPGFFRAQAGQWASVITKPHTLEGHLAMTMLGREYLFAAGVVTGLSRLMGTNDDVNYTDLTKPTWLALPTPGGGSISVLPTMAIPRLASRVVNNAVAASQGEENFDPTVALDAFARGRMSPMVSAVYENMNNKDFLGREYSSNADKWSSTMANLTLPIIMSSLTEDIKQEYKANGAGLGFNWQDIATNTGVNLMGKSIIPEHPRDKLDKAATAQFGTEWGLLTDAEKRTMRENPAVTALEAEYDFYSMQRAGSQEQRVDSAYKGYEEDVRHIWEDKTPIGNFPSSQVEDDEMIAKGQMPGDVWRERYHLRQQFVSQRFETLDGELRRAGVDPDQIRADKMQRLKEGRDPGSIAYLVQAAKSEYNGVEPGTVEHQVATPNGEVTVEVTDWDAFQKNREAVLARYPAPVAERVRREDASATPGIATYREASTAQKAIEAIPRYRNLSDEQGDRLDQMQGIMSKMAEQARSQMGLPPGTAVPGLTGAMRQQAVVKMQRAGIIRNEQDMQLAALAIMMQENPKLADTMRNPEQVLAVLQNPAAVVYYPYLRYRVPKQYWGKLPSQIFNAPVLQAELQAGG